MSVSTPKRLFLSVVASLLFSTSAAYAGLPSARAYAAMAYYEPAKQIILFGGESAFDVATQKHYDSDETWAWNGSRWVQLFPATHPAGRSAHGMTYDSNRSRIVLFGGRQARPEPDGQLTYLADTWVWRENAWTELFTPNAPSGRQLFGMAFDPIRDRVVLFGGATKGATADQQEILYDTWEFDGTTWRQVAEASKPQVRTPQLAFDDARNQMVLVGTDTDLKTLMYTYDAAAQTWVEVKPEKLPACANNSSTVARAGRGTLVLVGGLCSAENTTLDQTWEWDGTNWSEVKTRATSRNTAQAAAYDRLRDEVVTFGGFAAFTNVPRSATGIFGQRDWRFALPIARPEPRSLAAFRTDPTSNTVWMIGGLSDLGESYVHELWGYRNNQWFSVVGSAAPDSCTAPLAAYDTARSRFVLACTSENVWEWDGKTWKSITPKDSPTGRRFAAMVYDENIGKTVLFGGYDGTNHRNDTWTWDGTNWTEVKRNKPTARGLMTMWYDPLMKRTVIYGGLGRKDLDERVTRHSDMWSFDGSGWTKLNVTTTPGERFGAQAAVDPETGHLILFGGLVSEELGNDRRRQQFRNDTWRWDGSTRTWTAIATPRAPQPRQNGGLAWDPVAGELVLFAGYGGFYYSDVWAFTGTTWAPRGEATDRRRPAAPGVAPKTSPWSVTPPSTDIE